jgi:hypothetical protein
MDLIGLAVALGLLISLRLVFVVQEAVEVLKDVHATLEEEEGEWHEDIPLDGTADAEEDLYS